MSGFHRVLRFGSQGEDVEQLQALLNIWLVTTQTLVIVTQLAEDGIFGPKTQAAVIEFQKAHGVDADGVVGPITDAILSLYRDVLKKYTPNEKAFGARVAVMAEQELAWYGFRSGQDEFVILNSGGNNNQRIVASCCEGVKESVRSSKNDYERERWNHNHRNHQRRKRQGGKRLKWIFQHSGFLEWANKDTIDKRTETSYWTQGRESGRVHTDWCGIFCYYLYRRAGLTLGGGWRSGHQPEKDGVKAGILRRVGKDSVFPGCMGVEHKNNHFFIVSNILKDNKIRCIDGNAANTKGVGNWNPILSIITDRTRSIDSVMQFYFPILTGEFDIKKTV